MEPLQYRRYCLKSSGTTVPPGFTLTAQTTWLNGSPCPDLKNAQIHGRTGAATGSENRIVEPASRYWTCRYSGVPRVAVSLAWHMLAAEQLVETVPPPEIVPVDLE